MPKIIIKPQQFCIRTEVYKIPTQLHSKTNSISGPSGYLKGVCKADTYIDSIKIEGKSLTKEP